MATRKHKADDLTRTTSKARTETEPAPHFCFFFGEHPSGAKDILGGKGAGLAEMSRLGLPVPHGFTITTEACGEQWPEDLWAEVLRKVEKLEAMTEKKFGNATAPLLVSVRSGAAVSMPGMMDTVLNLGLNDTTTAGLAAKTQNPRFAYDSYRRFLCMFGNVVLGIEHDKFEHILTAIKKRHNRHFDCDLTAEELQEVITEFKQIYVTETGKGFPTEPLEQLRAAINAVFASWNNPRAVYYRKINDIRGLKGTAVNVQEMVFGNTGPRSGTGVGFTRNPSTGEHAPYGEYLVNAQGEDVVAGIRTPNPIARLEADLPEAYRQLMQVYRTLETHYRDMQDAGGGGGAANGFCLRECLFTLALVLPLTHLCFVFPCPAASSSCCVMAIPRSSLPLPPLEFTIEEGKLFMLQTRAGKRTAHAAVRIAKEMVEEGLITKGHQAAALQGPACLAQGGPWPAGFHGPGGHPAHQAGEKIILAREETCPDDIEGMNVSQGIVTARGGMTSHAAVVARGMGKCCITGAHDLHIDVAQGKLTLPDGTALGATDCVTLDGSTGEVFLGEVAIQDARLEGAFATIMQWANEYKRLGVRTNAETPRDARKAREFGCEGIGLARTEHMFFQGDRIWAMREMIIAETTEAREAALAKLLPYQKEDFKALLDIMDGLPVNIRLLDPPLHEFLPTEEKDQRQMAEVMHITVDQVRTLVDNMHEANPMLGFRGCRLGVVYPEINRMQVKAIFEAACELKQEKPAANMHIEVMIPVLAHEVEMRLMRELCVEEADRVLKAHGQAIPYTVGVMMELPRACLMADHIAKHAEFFSFGTNDLTQTTLGYRSWCRVIVVMQGRDRLKLGDARPRPLESFCWTIWVMQGRDRLKLGDESFCWTNNLLDLCGVCCAGGLIVGFRVFGDSTFFFRAPLPIFFLFFFDLPSRDDAGKFIKKYLERNVYEKDPFQCLDQDGVGQLIRMALQRGRATRPHLKCGICGEHGGEPSSVAFCHKVGLNYVSCSPFRVPVARLAAARAAIQAKGKAPEVDL
ncbi:Pyruvate phosphate dikinase [Paratrimastix pyriformis]|uniref:pyruvate, phosphate dikinase n=1 Tax=Paratrimastix pyriformis TaxID=342808 RepID=A0ABQ8UCJ7_9EUKA|nr:Pyruvate phosphate dikinase [Paratrimastix pyriformis]